MIQIRKSQQRGLADHGWLKSRHTFSFADFYDPAYMGFGNLRVINEDQISGGSGFDTHSHRDMEIISYVIDGALVHKDSMGNETVIRPGEVQRMSAGTGVRHSEYNQLKDRRTHFLQIWILPEKVGLEPSYGQKSFGPSLSAGGPVLVVSQTGRDGSVSINQNVDIYVTKSNSGSEKVFSFPASHKIWLQVVSGVVELQEQRLESGDGAAFTAEPLINLRWPEAAEFLLFDMA